MRRSRQSPAREGGRAAALAATAEREGGEREENEVDRRGRRLVVLLAGAAVAPRFLFVVACDIVVEKEGTLHRECSSMAVSGVGVEFFFFVSVCPGQRERGAPRTLEAKRAVICAVSQGASRCFASLQISRAALQSSRTFQCGLKNGFTSRKGGIRGERTKVCSRRQSNARQRPPTPLELLIDRNDVGTFPFTTFPIS